MSSEGRLSPAEAAEVLRRSRPIPTDRGASPVPVSAITGRRLSGGSASVPSVPVLSVPVLAPTLLLFLSATCGGCLDLFAAAQPGSGELAETGVRVVVIVRQADPALFDLIGDAEAAVSPDAWTQYQVSGPPFFSLVLPGRSSVAIEGVAWGAEAVALSVVRALGGDFALEVPRLEGP
ncbi:MAG: hypothetical protein WCG96_11205 [Actinomycetes bacterium]